MDKVELIKLIISKFDDRNHTVEYIDGELYFNVKDVEIPEIQSKVDADFLVGGNDFAHVVRFIIKHPVSKKGGYDNVHKACSKINGSITTGTYELSGQGESAMFCSSYSTLFFNSNQEESNVNKIMMFMFDSLLMEYGNILRTI